MKGKNGNIYGVPIFDKIEFFFSLTQKNNNRGDLKFTPNAYITVFVVDGKVFKRFF